MKGNGGDELSGDALVESTPAAYAVGAIIAQRYELSRVIGRGGMGEVWLARNRSLQADVAIKLILRAGATDDQCARLLQEAQATARVEHPGVVRIFDFGETERGDPFIAMELLRGEDLREVLLGKNRVPADEAVPLVLCVASALVAAHAKGVVHRDLKPENVVLVSGEGGVTVPKVVDFGIAKIVDREAAPARVITRNGVLVGSPDYMSPEQARGAPDVDGRTDVWSLCVVLYELLTGKVPFDGPNYAALIAAIMVDPPTPTVALLAGDKELWEITAKGLAKAPADRWQSMRDLGKALAQWAIAHGIETDAAGTSIARHWLSTSKPNLTRAAVSEHATAPPPRDASSIGLDSLVDSRRSTGVSVVQASRPPTTHAPAFVVALGVAAAIAGLALFASSRGAPGEAAASESSVATAAAYSAPATKALPAPAPTVAPSPSVVASAVVSSAAHAPPAKRGVPARAPKAPATAKATPKAEWVGGPGQPAMPVPTEAPF